MNPRHLHKFLYDGETGAEIGGNVITLHFADAQRGDDVLTVDCKIIDLGAPAFDEDSKQSSSGGSSSSCFIQTLTSRF